MAATVVLGGGLAGLAYAHYSQTPCLVLERAEQVGGMARSFAHDTPAGRFWFDCTGHWLHLKDREVAALVDTLLGQTLLRIQRRASIYSHGRLTPYPFQANTYGLPEHVVADCVLGFFRAREQQLSGEVPEPDNFEAYIRQQMGDGIAEHFMLPYNTKLWTVPPKEMAYSWCKRFVPTPTPQEVVWGAIKPAGAGHALGYNSQFYYPSAGGIGQLATTLAATLPHGSVRTGVAALEVDLDAKVVRTSTGERIGYDALVSTIALPDFIGMLAHAPETIRNAAARLRAVDVTHWNVGVSGEQQSTAPHWIYFPESHVPFYRVGSPSAAAGHLAPKGYRSYYVEVSHKRGTPPPVETEQILEGLYQVGLLGRDDAVLFANPTTLDAAYVLMDHDYGANREAILAWLEQQRVQSIGRYGSWTYDSMEGAIVQGRDAARRAPL